MRTSLIRRSVAGGRELRAGDARCTHTSRIPQVTTTTWHRNHKLHMAKPSARLCDKVCARNGVLCKRSISCMIPWPH